LAHVPHPASRDGTRSGATSPRAHRGRTGQGSSADAPMRARGGQYRDRACREQLMTRYLIRRLLYTVFVVWGAVTIIFVVMRFVPGDPAIALLGATATQAQIEAARTRLGLDDPVIVQYGRYVVRAAQLDFGESFRLGGPAMGHVLDRLPLTLYLALAST